MCRSRIPNPAEFDTLVAVFVVAALIRVVYFVFVVDKGTEEEQAGITEDDHSCTSSSPITTTSYFCGKNTT